jgi:hypothetical protein
VIEVGIKSLTMSDGSEVVVHRMELSPSSAQTTLARAYRSETSIFCLAERPRTKPRQLTALVVEKDGTRVEFEGWLDKNTVTESRAGTVIKTRVGAGEQARENLLSWWEGGPPFPNLSAFLRFYGGAENRLQASNGAGPHLHLACTEVAAIDVA